VKEDNSDYFTFVEENYCCPICPTGYNESFVLNPLLDQPICEECQQQLSLILIWPECRDGVVQLYPPLIQKIHGLTGLSYRECRRIYIDHAIASLTKEMLEEDGCFEGTRVIFAPDGSEMSCGEMLDKLRKLPKYYN
jgi:hypothetical protein